MRTGRSKPISKKTTQTIAFIRASITMRHEDRFCRNGNYNPDEFRPATGREIWRRWQFVYTGNARVPCWIVRVPKEIIWGHGGLWSDNSVAMLGALFRIHFPLTAEGMVAPPQRPGCAKSPGFAPVEPRQSALTGFVSEAEHRSTRFGWQHSHPFSYCPKVQLNLAVGLD